MRVLIGYDGSDCSEESFHDLQLAGLPDDVEVLVLTVANVWLPPTLAEGVDPAVKITPVAVERARAEASKRVDEATATAAQGASRLQSLFPAWQVSSEAVADSPGWAIIKRAAEWKADLVVVGATGHAGLNRIQRLTLGSTSQKIVIESPCSVRVARRREREATQPIRLVIGLDGSADSDLAVRSVAERRWPAGTEVMLLTAIDDKVVTTIFEPPAHLQTWIDETDEEPLSWVARMIADYRGRLEGAGLKVHSLVNHGDPKSLLLDEAGSWKADCIVLGARGHNLIERVLIGSVSTSITSRAECSVEVVR